MLMLAFSLFFTGCRKYFSNDFDILYRDPIEILEVFPYLPLCKLLDTYPLISVISKYIEIFAALTVIACYIPKAIINWGRLFGYFRNDSKPTTNPQAIVTA
ncbi:MAG: hypothetical protein LBN01_03965 [Endomicrobium sp.]|nr:hypothetical protein [Endomicrobium sp.]